jgi:hypothetical protein
VVAVSFTIYAELERVICSGPHRGGESTYALFDSRAPQSPRLPRDEALGELSNRYLRSHGPATVRDFSWWSGLTMADAKRGLAIARARSHTVEGLTSDIRRDWHEPLIDGIAQSPRCRGTSYH